MTIIINKKPIRSRNHDLKKLCSWCEQIATNKLSWPRESHVMSAWTDYACVDHVFYFSF